MDCAHPPRYLTDLPIGQSSVSNSGRAERRHVAAPHATVALSRVQEALANVYRHACASRVSVDLRWIVDRVHVIVTDNGRGAVGSRGASVPTRGGIYGIQHAHVSLVAISKSEQDLTDQDPCVTLVERDQRLKASKAH